MAVAGGVSRPPQPHIPEDLREHLRGQLLQGDLLKEAAEALNRSRVSSQLPILEIAKDFLTKHVQAAGKLRA